MRGVFGHVEKIVIHGTGFKLADERAEGVDAIKIIPDLIRGAARDEVARGQFLSAQEACT